MIVSRLMTQIIESVILQIVTGNVDLHYKNLVLLDGGHPTMASNFDYGKCDLVDYDISSYALQAAPLNFSEKNNARFTIFKFLNLSSLEYRDLFLQMIFKIPNFDTVISILEQQIERLVPSEIKHSLYKCYVGEKDKILKIVSEIFNLNEENTMKGERK